MLSAIMAARGNRFGSFRHIGSAVDDPVQPRCAGAESAAVYVSSALWLISDQPQADWAGDRSNIRNRTDTTLSERAVL